MKRGGGAGTGGGYNRPPPPPSQPPAPPPPPRFPLYDMPYRGFDFYEDLFEELEKYREIESLNICDNLAEHMEENLSNYSTSSQSLRLSSTVTTPDIFSLF